MKIGKIGITAMLGASLFLNPKEVKGQASNINLIKVKNTVIPSYKSKIPKIKNSFLESVHSKDKNDIINGLKTYLKKNKLYAVLEGDKNYNMYLDSLILSDLRYLQGKIDKFPQNLNGILKRNHSSESKFKFDKYGRFEYILYNEWTRGLFIIKTNNPNNMSRYREGNVYTTVIGKNIVVYFMNKNKDYTIDDKVAIVAYHPKIKPNHLCTDDASSPNRIVSTHFDKPKRKIITIDYDLLSSIGITKDNKESFMAAINNEKYQLKQTNKDKAPVKSNNIDTIKVNPKIEINDIKLDTIQYEKNEQNHSDKLNISTLKTLFINRNDIINNTLNISDYEIQDGDLVEISSISKNPIELNNKGIDFDISKICGNQILIKILNEGTQSPNTLKVKWGNKEQFISGKKGDMIIIDINE